MERYVLTTEMFIYAENEAKAKSLAKYIEGKPRKMYDNQCHASSLNSCDFGRLPSDTNLLQENI